MSCQSKTNKYYFLLNTDNGFIYKYIRQANFEIFSL